MTEKAKATAAKMTPEHTLKIGDVIASIFRRQSNTGFVYWDFTLSRSWSTQATGKESQGGSYFESNEQDIIEATKAAAAWIREKNNGITDPESEGPAINPLAD